MKKLILFLLLMSGTYLMSAQNYNRYNRYDRNVNQRWERGYAGTNDLRYIPIRLRHRLNELEFELMRRKRQAMRDGFISRREARRINRVQRQMDELIWDYRRDLRRTGRRNGRCR
jgi:hypothetical protein